MGVPCNFEEPHSLKACLQLMAKLNRSTDLRSTVLLKIKDKLRNYCDLGSHYMSQVAATGSAEEEEEKDDDDDEDEEGEVKEEVEDPFFNNMFQNSEKLLQIILKGSSSGQSQGDMDYGTYSCLQNSEEYANKCASALEKYLPQVCVALYYLYFNVSDRVNSIMGGGWSNLQLNNTGATENHLKQWLTSSGHDSNLMPRGFADNEFSQSPAQGSTLNIYVKEFVRHDSAGELQYALLGMIFISKWSDTKTKYGLTGHACLFLHTFCTQVKDDSSLKSQFKTSYSNGGVTFDRIKDACNELKDKLDKFVTGSNDNKIQAVCYGSTTLYSELWNPANLEKYVDWLKQNLLKLKDSLKQMSSDCSNWSQESLKKGESAGPFKYGFVFTDAWNGDSSGMKGQLQSIIVKITSSGTGTLDCLKSKLEDLQTSTSHGATWYTFPFQTPTTLKECLQLLANLKSDTLLKSKVVNKIKAKVGTYCDPDSRYMEKFGEDTGDLYYTFYYAETILFMILGSTRYGQHHFIHPNSVRSYVSCIANAIQKILPCVYTTLSFLYFHVSSDCIKSKGGTWRTMQIRDGRCTLYKWLNDQVPINRLYDGSVSPWIVRGFMQEDFKSPSSGWEVAAFLEDLVKHSAPGHVQNALVGMLFICPWCDALTGYAVCFLWQFCNDDDNSFEEELEVIYNESENLSQLKEECTTLKNELKPFIDVSEYSEDGSEETEEPKGLDTLRAVCQKNNDLLYSDLWDPEKLDKYIDWLKENLTDIITSLRSMSSDCSNWRDNLDTAASAGPFKYGFVFADVCNGSSSENGISITAAIQKLISSLSKLNNLLNGLMHRSSVSSNEAPPGSSCPPFRMPTSLNDYLCLFAVLYNSPDMKPAVLKALKESLQEYCTPLYASGYIADTSYLSLTFQYSYFLLRRINNSTDDSVFGLYHDLLDSDHERCECIGRIVIALSKESLFRVFAILCFIYFNTSSDCNTLRGGKWSGMHLKGSNGLVQWLTDSVGSVSQSKFIKRGFQETELNSTSSAFTLAFYVKKLVDITYGGSLGKAIEGFLFFGSWDHSKLAHALLFLYEFCSRLHTTSSSILGHIIQRLNLPGTYSELRHICKRLRAPLARFVTGTEIQIRPVALMRTVKYSQLWDNNNTYMYVDWLEKNLANIMRSLQRMSWECTTWVNDAKFSTTSAGPFKYGFVFKDGQWVEDVPDEIRPPISKLIASIEDLNDFFHPSSSTSTIVGGVTSGIAAVGAGVAYAFNIGGFANFVQGALSALSGLVA